MKLFQSPLRSATMDDLEKDDIVEGCVISLRNWDDGWPREVGKWMNIKGHPTPLGHLNNGWLWGNETMVKLGEMEQIINSRKNKVSWVPLWKWDNEWMREIEHWMKMELNRKAKFHGPCSQSSTFPNPPIFQLFQFSWLVPFSSICWTLQKLQKYSYIS